MAATNSFESFQFRGPQALLKVGSPGAVHDKRHDLLLGLVWLSCCFMSLGLGIFRGASAPQGVEAEKSSATRSRRRKRFSRRVLVDRDRVTSLLIMQLLESSESGNESYSQPACEAA